LQRREEESDEEGRAAHVHDPSTRSGRGSIESAQARGPTGRGAGGFRDGEGALFTELPPGEARRVLR
jgi:hypothetical protein